MPEALRDRAEAAMWHGVECVLDAQVVLARIPAGRWGEPSDIGGAAVFLAAPASDYVNGHVLVVDGGWLAR